MAAEGFVQRVLLQLRHRRGPEELVASRLGASDYPFCFWNFARQMQLEQLFKMEWARLPVLTIVLKRNSKT